VDPSTPISDIVDHYSQARALWKYAGGKQLQDLIDQAESLSSLEDIPGIGPSYAQDIRRDLKGAGCEISHPD